VVLAESEEAANHLVDATVAVGLSRLGDLVQEIHITDQKAYNSYPMWLQATFFVDTSSEERIKACAQLVKLLFHMVDKAASLRLTGAAKAKAEKARKSADKERARQVAADNEEETLKKKREKENEYIQKLKSLPPDQQRKLEEKKRAKEMHNMKKRVSKIVKF
jgi:oligoribonuclease NrnB/cAMP/cGMP phosphodiesterase (DHH superfamily)